MTVHVSEHVHGESTMSAVDTLVHAVLGFAHLANPASCNLTQALSDAMMLQNGFCMVI